MPLYYLLVLALVQGITEFLPISSSGHLILMPDLLGEADQGVGVDVAVHVGTLLAVVLYFWADVKRIFWGAGDIARGRSTTQNAKLTSMLILATMPVLAAGLAIKITGLSDEMRNIEVIGWTMIVFGVILYGMDKLCPAQRTADSWGLKDALIMGVWQAIALIPGTSRSGATITGARMLGFTRHDGTKLAMLMSIPTIMASGLLLTGEVVALADWRLARDAAIGAGFAFVAALMSLSVMMRFLDRVSYTPYVIYRVLLGLVLLWIAYT
ncbi:MAG: undecaprenyl-diphosphate phosphatase [Pseudomonadota bacterium]